MNSIKKNIYVDANVFIIASTYPEDDPKFKHAKNFLYKISGGDVEASTSFLTWDELFWIIRRLAGNDAAKIESRKFLELPNLKFIDVNEHITMESQSLVEKYNLKPRDAIHAASAILNNADIISDDPDFDAIKELRRRTLEEI